METPKRKGKLKKFLIYFISILVVIVVGIYISFKISPWPGAMLIRMEFTKGGETTNENLAKYAPSDVTIKQNIKYMEGSDDTYLDVYFPNSVDNTSTLLPTVVWIHGGAWLAGDKSELSNYSKILSSKGFTVIQLNYSLAPGSHYPVPVKQTNEALNFILKNAKDFHIDTNKILLAGDSGGAQIAAQLSAIITSKNYADIVNITPYLKPESLKGVILFCGPYNLKDVNLEGAFGAFLETVLWAYSGTKDFQNNKFFYTGSVIDYVTKDFPNTFISVGNNDPLNLYSYQLSDKLISLGVKTDTLYFPENYTPALPHEYQFNLDVEAGNLALQKTVEFINLVTSNSIDTNKTNSDSLIIN